MFVVAVVFVAVVVAVIVRGHVVLISDVTFDFTVLGIVES